MFAYKFQKPFKMIHNVEKSAKIDDFLSFLEVQVPDSFDLISGSLITNLLN